MVMSTVQQAQVRRTRLFFEDRELFMKTLVSEIRSAIKSADRKGLTAVFRLNGTSDLRWEAIPAEEGRTVLELFPSVQFYDYTKLSNRKNIPRNYHLTFSRSEDNEQACKQALANGLNVAVVFRDLPKRYLGKRVVAGDDDDLRFLDPKGVVVGLKAKGKKAREDKSGFTVQCAQKRG
jgi:hypothetical protein